MYLRVVEVTSAKGPSTLSGNEPQPCIVTTQTRAVVRYDTAPPLRIHVYEIGLKIEFSPDFRHIGNFYSIVDGALKETNESTGTEVTTSGEGSAGEKENVADASAFYIERKIELFLSPTGPGIYDVPRFEENESENENEIKISKAIESAGESIRRMRGILADTPNLKSSMEYAKSLEVICFFGVSTQRDALEGVKALGLDSHPPPPSSPPRPLLARERFFESVRSMGLGGRVRVPGSDTGGWHLTFGRSRDSFGVNEIAIDAKTDVSSYFFKIITRIRSLDECSAAVRESARAALDLSSLLDQAGTEQEE